MRNSMTLLPVPLSLLIVALIMPTELSVCLAGMRLAPHRVVLLLVVPFAIWRMLSAPDIRVRHFDVAFLLYNAWTFGVFLHHGDTELTGGYNAGSSGAFAYGGSLALEGFGGYIVARAYIRDGETAVRAVRLLVGVIAVAAALALPEALSGKHVAHELMGMITGSTIPLKYETRMGLERAYSTFDHPIVFGTFCASILAIVWMAEPMRTRRIAGTIVIGMAVALSLSSAPMLSLVVQACLIGWERVTRGISGRVLITVAVVCGLMIGASLVSSRSPAAFIATGMTLDSWTGYYRLLIWEHGFENVMANPVTGIGLADWARPWWMHSDSIDAFWLIVPLRAGIPAFFFLVLGICLILRRAARPISRRADPGAWRFRAGWVMSLLALSLIGCTVHLWNALYTFFFLLIGMGGWIADPRQAPSRQVSPVRPRRNIIQPLMQPT
jgi:hypothetical protein